MATPDILELLQRIDRAGGTITVVEDECREAEELGLVHVTPEGGGFGYTQSVKLTDYGRRAIGLPATGRNRRNRNELDTPPDASDHRNTGISATVPNWSRETKAQLPQRSLLASIRLYNRCRNSRNPLHQSLKYAAIIQHWFWSVYTGTMIPINVQIGGGLLMPHPNGIVINPSAVIGPNCLIFQQVTLTDGVVLGGHVDIGAGAKIIGPLTIGDHAVVGANAVVTKDVPPGVTVAGVPARIIRSRRAADAVNAG